MPRIYVDVGSAAGVANPFAYNSFSGQFTSAGQVTADLLDSTGASTGVSLHTDVAFGSTSVSGGLANTGVGEYTEAVLDANGRTGVNTSSTIRLAGLPSGASYTLQFVGHTTNSGRHTRYTVEGSTVDYTTSGDANAPNGPVSIAGTVDPDGEIIIDIEKTPAGTFYGYLSGFDIDYSTTATFAIDSTDASMQRDGTFDVTFSNPATTPTTGNTSLAQGGDTLTCTSVTGSDPYTATFSVGDLSKQVDATGYDWTLTVDAETDTTGNIPLTIQADYTLVNLTSPDTTNASLLFGVTGDTPITGDDLEYDVTSTLDSGVTFSVANDGVWTVTEATEGDWVTDITVDRRVVQADGTIGTTATLTLSASTGAVIGIISDLVTDMVTDLVTEMVN